MKSSAEHRQAVWQAGHDVLRIVPKTLDRTPVGIRAGVEREPQIQEHDLLERGVGCKEPLWVVAQHAPQLRQQSDEILAVGPEVPLRIQSDVAMHNGNT